MLSSMHTSRGVNYFIRFGAQAQRSQRQPPSTTRSSILSKGRLFE